MRWLTVAALVIDAAAFYSIWHSPVHSRAAKGLWTAIVLVIPFLGALGWVALGREAKR